MVVATHTFRIIFQMLDKITAPLNRVDKNLKAVRKSTEQVSKSVHGLSKGMLGLGLGMTFFLFGVQIQLKKLLKTAFQFFKEAQGETGALIVQFNILRANLAGLAIAFFDALSASGFLQIIIGVVISLRRWFMDLTESEREWLSASVFIFLGIITGISLIGQALLAVFVLSQLNPIILFATLTAVAIGALAIAFVLARDDIEEAVGDMKTDWEKFIEVMRRPITFDNLLDTAKEAFIRLRIIWLDFFIFLQSIPIFRLVFPLVPAGGLQKDIATRERLIASLEPEPTAGIAPALGGLVAAGQVKQSLVEIGQLPERFRKTLEEGGGLLIKPSDKPFNVETRKDNELNIFNAKDEEKLEKAQTLIDEIIDLAKDTLDGFDGLKTEMTALADRPIDVTVNVQGASPTE